MSDRGDSARLRLATGGKHRERSGPRRMRLAGGTLVLPPVSLRDLPPDGVIGRFMDVAALRFATAAGIVAVFLHDLRRQDLDAVLAQQRAAAEDQLGSDYARIRQWWEHGAR